MKAAMARAGISEPVILEDFVDIGFDQGLKKGLKKGRSEGREEGREEGHTQGFQHAVLALAERLGVAVDERRRAEIDAMNEEQLASALEKLARLGSFD